MITLQNRPNHAEEYIQSWYFAILKCWHAINHNFYWVHHLTIQFAMHGNYLQTVPDMLPQKLSCPIIMQEWLSKAGHCTLSYKLPVGDRNWRSLVNAIRSHEESQVITSSCNNTINMKTHCWPYGRFLMISCSIYSCQNGYKAFRL